MTQIRETRQLIAELPADDAVAAVEQIAEALRALSGANAVGLEARYADIALLDFATVEHTRKLLDEYLFTSRHMKQRESDLWNGAFNCWRELAHAYSLCVEQYTREPGAAAHWQETLCVAVVRGMRAMRRQLQWLRIRYARPTPAIWQGLAALYAQVQAQDAGKAITVYPGVITTFNQELLKALVLAVLPSENLKPREQDLATYLVGRFAPLFVVSSTPVAGCTHTFDFAAPDTPQPIAPAQASQPALRYFGPGAAYAAIQQAIATLDATGSPPPALKLPPQVDAAQARAVLAQIAVEWAGEPHERRSERQSANTRVTVVPGLAAIYDVLEQAQADPFNFADRPEGESWLANDVSPDGFGVVMPPVIGDWVSVGSVAAIEGDPVGGWSVGMVRRVRRLEDGQQHIGVEVLSREPMAIRVMREMSASQAARTTQRLPVDRAIVLTADAAQQPEIEFLVTDPAPYGEGRLHALIGDHVLLVSLARVIETTDFCSRIVVKVHGTDA